MLVGYTEFDLESFAATAYSVAQLGVNSDADQYPGKLSEDERVISSLMGVERSSVSLSQRLRTATAPLRFLHYAFLVEYDRALDPFVQSFCLDSLFINDRVCLIQGDLMSWISAMLAGTNTDDPVVIEFFDRIYLYLKEVRGLQVVLGRFHVIKIPNSHLFRLRYQ